MGRQTEKLVTRPVSPVTVGEIRDLVEPVRCLGGTPSTHDPVETECVDTGVGYVIYECSACGLRVKYYHSSDGNDPCCSPRT